MQEQLETMDHQRDVEQEIELLRASIPAKDLKTQPTLRIKLGQLLVQRYDEKASASDLIEAIIETERAILDSESSGNTPCLWTGYLGRMIFRRYLANHELPDLELAIFKTNAAASKIQSDDREYPILHNDLRIMFHRKYERTNKIPDLSKAILHAETAESIDEKNPLGHGGELNYLGVLKLWLYQRTNTLAYLDNAILDIRKALDDITTATGSTDINAQHNLASMLFTRFRKVGEIDNLNEAIVLEDVVVDHTPKEHPSKAMRESGLSSMYFERYEQRGHVDDLNNAFKHSQIAFHAAPDPSVSRLVMAAELAAIFIAIYDKTKTEPRLNQAISILRETLDATKDMDDVDTALQWNDLGRALSRKYQLTANFKLLEEALEANQNAIDANQGGDAFNLATWRGNLAGILIKRYEHSGNYTDLESAIQASKEAVDQMPESYYKRARLLSNLSHVFMLLYQRTGDEGNLEEATLHAQAAVEAAHEHRLRVDEAAYHDTLASLMKIRFERSQNEKFLDLAVLEGAKAVSSSSPEHPYFISRMTNHGAILGSRFQLNGNDEGFDETIVAAKELVSTMGEGDFYKGQFEFAIAVMLHSRYSRGKRPQDLNDAILRASDGLARIPQTQSRWGSLGHGLGLLYLERFHSKGDLEDETAALSLFLKSLAAAGSVPLTRLRAARACINVYKTRQDWQGAIIAAEKGLQLLPLVCVFYLSWKDQLHAIIQASGLAADACSLSLKVRNAEKALEHLEYGRGFILGYLIDIRREMPSLKNDCPELAEQFDALRFKASRPVEYNQTAIQQQMLDDRREAGTNLGTCVEEIRRVKGHENFLKGTTKNGLTWTWEGAIVLVNVTDISGDAIIVTAKGIKALPLPKLSGSQMTPQLKRKAQSYAASRTSDQLDRDMQGEADDDGDVKFLDWLWLSCVKPVIEELKNLGCFTSLDPPRVWWSSSGIASSLPFHAAGSYGGDSISENALDLIISSYTPTLKGLMHVKRQQERLDQAHASSTNTSILVVSMPTTPGQKSLPGATDERHAIENVSRGVWPCVSMEYPTAAEVLSHIPGTGVLHFACHGSVDRADPSNSHLLLQKKEPGSGKLVVDKLALSALTDVNDLEKGWIAYLSACSTAQVKSRDLADEGIHLASAFQLAGFPHVIGSLWSVDDAICVEVAKSFYESLAGKEKCPKGDGAVAQALREAVLKIRAKHADPSLWASFVHLGA